VFRIMALRHVDSLPLSLEAAPILHSSRPSGRSYSGINPCLWTSWHHVHSQPGDTSKLLYEILRSSWR
jgi:hypothetical protein